MPKRSFLFQIILVLAANTLGAADVVTFEASRRGWVSETGELNDTTTYIAGFNPQEPGEFRNFFEFDPVFSGTVAAATLILETGGFESPDPSETFQVTSIPASFTFADLGTGTAYGTREYSEADDCGADGAGVTIRRIVLNPDAIAQIASGQTFRLGGRITTLSGQDTQYEFVFSAWDCTSSSAKLELVLGDPQPGDIDANGAADALTDGLLYLRYLFGFRGEALIESAVAANCNRCTAEEIEAALALLAPSAP